MSKKPYLRYQFDGERFKKLLKQNNITQLMLSDPSSNYYCGYNRRTIYNCTNNNTVTYNVYKSLKRALDGVIDVQSCIIGLENTADLIDMDCAPIVTNNANTTFEIQNINRYNDITIHIKKHNNSVSISVEIS